MKAPRRSDYDGAFCLNTDTNAFWFYFASIASMNFNSEVTFAV